MSRVSTSRAGKLLIAGSICAAAVLVVAYLAAGGSSYEPTPSADPCMTRAWRDPEGIEESARQFALSALDGAACELSVSREQLAVALGDRESRERFAAEHGIGAEELEAAVRAGLVRAIDDATRAGALSPLLATGLREVAARVPVEEAVGLIGGAVELFDDAEGALEGVVDRLGGLVP